MGVRRLFKCNKPICVSQIASVTSHLVQFTINDAIILSSLSLSLTFIWSRRAVAKLVCMSMLFFLSMSSGRELGREGREKGKGAGGGRGGGGGEDREIKDIKQKYG